MDAHVLIAREAVPSVVHLQCQVPSRHPSAAILGRERMGAGVAVGERRVLTAHYLVLGASRVDVLGADGRARPVGRSVVHHETGLALLALDGPPLRAVRPAPAEAVRPGLPVFLVTSMGARERKAATGHVTAVEPFEAFWEYMLDRAVMTTVVNPGLAGAPLFDGGGQLLGIVSLGLAAVGRYSLAIPVELFEAHRPVLEGEVEAGPSRAWLGIYPQANDGGVVLTGVVPGGPADSAGLLRGDWIVSVDGERITSLRDLYRGLWRHAAFDRVRLQLLRDDVLRVVEVRAGDRYAFYA